MSNPNPDCPDISGFVFAADSPLVPILKSLKRIANSKASVLVTGESGVGKEGVSRALHSLAPWGHGPFIPTNCGAIPEALLESELFGHVKGAFTGADRARIGRFEAASNGTLFLDEIGEMPLAVQVKFLRVLQEREFEPVGSTTRKKADFRLVACTHRDLAEMVEKASFRQDLFFRLDVVRLHIPPLRDRPMDIPPLVRHFIEIYSPLNFSEVKDITDDALALLQHHVWPGNIRELENVIQGILVLKDQGRIDAEDIARRLHGRLPTPTTLPDTQGPSTHGGPAMDLPEEGLNLRGTLEAMEKRLIRQALKRSDGNKTAAANLLALNRTTLVEKLKRIGDES
jgi:transcriptional regulator with PAS, ATPase and Fis domain